MSCLCQSIAGRRNGGLTDGQQKLYDRQIGALGMDVMNKLIQLSVLVVGMNGLGVEIAKNIILAGPKSVTIADDEVVEEEDLCSQFYVDAKDIGKNRASACVSKLQNLNPYVSVQAIAGSIDDATLLKHNAVVYVSGKLGSLLRVNDLCRKKGIAFVAADVHGLFGSIFVDFGPKDHFVFDADGERPRQAYIASIEKGNPTIVNMLEDFPYAFQNGDHVKVSEVVGMSALNSHRPMRVTVRDKFSIELNVNTTGSKFKAYTGGGVLEQVKIPSKVRMRSLADCLRDPDDLLIPDFSKFESPLQQHLALHALRVYEEENGRPKAHSKSVFKKVLAIAERLGKEMTPSAKPDKIILRNLTNQYGLVLCPMASIIGGIVCQEVIKLCGKFNPLKQLLYYDALECLPAHMSSSEEDDDEEDLPARYSDQVSIFGKSFQIKLMKQKYFLVGSGALGCELLKNFSMMGLGCHPDGMVFVTDNDRIEVSNLNRQFLFHAEHVGQSKSVVAAEQVCTMNTNFNVTAMEKRVGPETEDFFNDSFWNRLDGVANALDNVEARLYIDSQCIRFAKPLFESGTLGTKANVQVVLPSLTESYGSSRDPPEQEVPACTLHNFPYLIQHTIQLAREKFDSLFSRPFSDLQAWFDRGEMFLESLQKLNVREQRVILEGILSAESTAEKKPNFDDCIIWARELFEDMFSNQIKQLLYLLPPDKKDEFGNPFWTGTKRPPSPIAFDHSNPLHMDFIMAAASMRAFNFGVSANEDVGHAKSVAKSFKAAPFSPDEKMKVQTKEDEDPANLVQDDDEKVVEQCIKRLPKKQPSLKPRKGLFEKDDDLHIDFIAAAANLRADNYKIETVSRDRIKMIAGRIIPALASTTAMVTGMVCLEIIKRVVHGDDAPLEIYRNSFVNLALPAIVLSEPMRAKMAVSPGPDGEVYYPEGFTLWDRIKVDEGNVTVQEFIDYFDDEHGVEVTSIACGETLLYASFLGNRDRLSKRITRIYSRAQEEKAPIPNPMILSVGGTLDGEDCETASVYLYWPRADDTSSDGERSYESDGNEEYSS